MKPEIMDDINKNIAILKGLSDKFLELDQVSKDGDKTIYNVRDGDCWGSSLWNQSEVAVQRSFISKGATFPSHAHQETEVLIVYVGKVRICFPNGVECIIKAGDPISFFPGVEHEVTALEDTWLIGVTIPRSKVYPGGQQSNGKQ